MRETEQGAEVRSSSRWLRLGIGCAVLVGIALSTLAVLSIKPFRPADENAHVGYVQTIVGEGRLPLVTETVVPGLPLQRTVPQHTANHPPLFYLLEAPLFMVGESVGRPLLGFFAGRALSAIFGGLTVLLAGVLGYLLTARRRPRVAIGTALLVATFAPFIAVAGFFHNDSLAAAMSTLALAGLTAIAIGIRGRWPMIAVVVGCCLGLLTRAQNVGAVLVCCIGLVLIYAVRPGRWDWRAALAGLNRALIVGLLCVAAAGWFYLRNLSNYGDPTGGAKVIDLLHLAPRDGTVVHQLLLPGTWLTLFLNQPYWVGHATVPPSSAPLWISLLCLGIVALGAAALVVRRVLDRSPVTRSQPALRVVQLLLAGLILLNTFEGASHVLAGGNLHGRYMFGAIGAVAAVAAVCLLALPGGRRGQLIIAISAVQAVIATRYIGFLATTVNAARKPPEVSTPARMALGMDLNGVPAPTVAVWLLIVVVAGGICLAGYAMFRADDSHAPSSSEQTSPVPVSSATAS